MEIVLVLIPLSLFLLTIAILLFRWAVRNGQYDDLDSPAHRILFDDDLAERKPKADHDHKQATDQDSENSTDDRSS